MIRVVVCGWALTFEPVWVDILSVAPAMQDSFLLLDALELDQDDILALRWKRSSAQCFALRVRSPPQPLQQV